ncbi:MAG TPA: N-methyl-L-tryptophan oxidase [Segeticoccus sp.]|uniref:N-methyl-L-tryptophan oxidase n=1 Tax=Segeticoccus sp. TaxID=2706531 RepID=UPI002D80FB0D|nr:N-methyl-L-tryptophan oxidase [Segeticoccus sp.]HET8601208.1 N-methyl-L-tryptophan oxidase [Segeticoccus sp.]
MTAYDVVVVGLGAMGSSAARHLAARGLRVLGLEQFTPAHDRGSSHGDSRMIRQAYLEHPSYVPLLQHAYPLWEELGERAHQRLLTETGGVMIGRPDSGAVAGSRRSAEQWGLPHELLDATGLRERFPTFSPGDDEVALYEERAGFVRPEATVRAQVEAATEDGADLRFGEPVTGWRATGSGVRVSTAAESFDAGHLVLAPGAWAPRLLDLPIALTVERQILHWYAPTGGTEPFAVGRHPVWIWEDPDGDEVYGFPALPGETEVKVAFFRRPVPADPDHVDRVVHPEEVAEMDVTMRRKLPALAQHTRAVTCLYTLTPDSHFVLGRHPEYPQVSVAAGFSGHGFKFTPLVGEILADLATEGTTPHDVSLFDPARPALRR